MRPADFPGCAASPLRDAAAGGSAQRLPLGVAALLQGVLQSAPATESGPCILYNCTGVQMAGLCGAISQEDPLPSCSWHVPPQSRRRL